MRDNESTYTIPIQGEPTAVLENAAARGSSVEDSVRSEGPQPDVAHPRPLSTGSDAAFKTPLLRADDVSEVTDDFRSSRSSASRRGRSTAF